MTRRPAISFTLTLEGGRPRPPCLECGSGPRTATAARPIINHQSSTEPQASSPKAICNPFTLIEVLVAMLILSLVLAVAMMGVQAVMQSWDHLNTHAKTFSNTLQIDRTVEEIFSNAIPFHWQDETATKFPIFQGTGSSVTLAYMHRVNRLEDGAIRFAQLQLERGDLVCYYVERPPFPTNLSLPRVRRSILATGVADIALTYADLDGDQIVFVDDWGDRDQMPLAIQLRVTWDDGESTTWLYRTAGSSFHERYGDWKQKSNTNTQ